MQLVKDKTLANGMTLSFFDCSKLLAADRWFVKMQGEMKFSLAGVAWPDTDGLDPQVLAKIKERIGDSVSFNINKERKFIDADEKDAVLAEMIAQVEDNLIGYLEDSSFRQKLFDKQYEEMRKQCLVEFQQSQLPIDDDDEGPADFSACFKD